MARKIFAFLTAIALLLPAAALGEATALPYGLSLGMNAAQTEAAFAADATLAAATFEKVDDGDGTVEYLFENVAIPGTELTAATLSVQIDLNNSLQEDRLTSVDFSVLLEESGIPVFRRLLASMTDALGAPDGDSFDESGVEQYVEWGTLDASWTKADVRVSLSLSRMYGDGVSVLYSSRLNYDEADLAE
jgi:hypothetical protein